MASRCRACNCKLSEIELRLKREDGQPEDICVACKVYIRDSIESDDLHIGHIPWHSVQDSYLDYEDYFNDRKDEYEIDWGSWDDE